MFDDLASYYHENVVAAFIAYSETSRNGVARSSRDLREALGAASALYHLREHLPKALAISRAETEEQCADYGLLGDIVNTSKHRSTTRSTPHGPPLVKNAECLGEVHAYIDYEDALGTYQWAHKLVVVKLTNGTERDLFEVLTNVLNFWEDRLNRYGILTKRRIFEFDPLVRHRTRAECEKNRLDLVMVQGHRLARTMQFLKFDPNTGQALSKYPDGSKVNVRIYKPRIEFDMWLQHEGGDKKYKKTVVLSDDECQKLEQLSNVQDRHAFVSNLPASRAAYREISTEARQDAANGEEKE